MRFTSHSLIRNDLSRSAAILSFTLYHLKFLLRHLFSAFVGWVPPWYCLLSGFCRQQIQAFCTQQPKTENELGICLSDIVYCVTIWSLGQKTLIR